MALSSKKNSEIVVQMLYSFEMGSTAKEEVLSLLMDELKVTAKEIHASFSEAKEIWENRQKCDEIIARTATGYELGRIGLVEKCILRFTLFQVAFLAKDSKEIVAEGLRLSKKFCSSSASAFVHALLEKAYGSSLSSC
jgi:transcription termination factor NusB